jgi:parvulin-like peptidyl-prolyl isomerase
MRIIKNLKTTFYSAVIITIISMSGNLSAQKSTIASINGGVIKLQDVIERYTLTPFVEDKVFASDSGKTQILASLIAEKLWAKEAEELGFTEDEQYKSYIAVLKKMFIRDALFKEVIEKKVKITDAEQNLAKLKSGKVITALIFSDRDSVSSYKRYATLNSGVPFDSLYLAQKDSASKMMYAIHYGDIESEEIEDSLYLTNAGCYTAPMFDGKTWHIFKVVKIEDAPKQTTDPLKLYKQKLKERRVKKIGEKYLADLLKDARIDINQEPVKVLASTFKKRINELYHKTAADSTLYLNEAEIAAIRKTFSRQRLLQPVIMFKEQPVTLNEVLGNYAFNSFSIKSYELPHIFGKVIKDIHNMTKDELLTREGLRFIPGADALAEEQLGAWKSNALAQALRNRYLDSVKVSDKEVEDYYLKMNSSQEAIGKIEVQIIFSKNLDTVSAVLDEIKAGKDFISLARQHAQSKYSANTPMPYNHFTPFENELRKASYNDVVGPVKGDEGYYLFKILVKKEADSLFVKPFAQVKEELGTIYKSKTVDRKLNEKTVKLAVKYSLSLNEGMLKQLKGSEIPMFVYRFIGFGGRIAAAPFTSPMYQWLNDFKKLSNINP